ncbi:MAG: PD-(D/E)XK nuclease-like domain-containing protein [Planctomycetota bacterium]
METTIDIDLERALGGGVTASESAGGKLADPYTDEIILSPGVYPNMPDAEYRRVQAVSKSDLDKWAGGSDIDPRVALLGTVFHACILEPGVASERIVRADIDRRSKAKWDELCEANAGKWVLTKGEYADVSAWVDACMRDAVLSATRDHAHANPDRTELVVVWRDSETGLVCKAKIDQNATSVLVDWKTTSCSGPDDFALSAAKFGYGMQAVHYQRGFKAATGEEKAMAFACIGKRKDHGNPTWVYRPTAAEIASGERQLRQLIHLFCRYQPDHPALIPF